MRIRLVSQDGAQVSILREPEAEALYRGGMAKPVGRGSKVRCLMLTVSKGAAFRFLRGTGGASPSRTVVCERVGAQRKPVYTHMQRSFGFGGTDSLPIVTREPAPVEVCATVAQIPEAPPGEPEAETCTQLLAVDNSCLQAETEIAVHPEGKEEVEGKEPEGAIVEPTTPDVVVMAETIEEPQHITPATIPEGDITNHRSLGQAVLLRAFEDAKSDPVARRWFEQRPQPMLEFWCQVAGVDCGQVRKRAAAAG